MSLKICATTICRFAPFGVALLIAASSLALAQSPKNPPVVEWLRQGIQTRSTGYPGMGYLPAEEKDFRRHARFRIVPAKRGERPPRLLLTEFLPPVNTQGKQNSCVAWAVAYYCYTYGVARQRKLTPEQRSDPKFQFSPAFIYNLGKNGEDRGMSLSRAFELLKGRGCATFAEMPYDDKDSTTPPSEAANARAERYKAREVGFLFKHKQLGGEGADPERLKTFLAETRQPFVIAIPVFRDFPRGKVDKDFIYDLTIEPTKENLLGGHALAVVGYDEAKRAFRMVNSWGATWGDEGFFWMSEAYVKNWSLEGWADVAGGPIARGALTPRVTLEPPAMKE